MRDKRSAAWGSAARRAALAGAALVGAFVGAVGSASAQTTCLGYGQVGTWYTSSDCKATVCSDGSEAGMLEFKDEDGNVLQTVTMELAGCVSVPIPHGTANYDWKVKAEPSTPAEGPPVVPLALTGLGHGGTLPPSLVGGALPEQGGEVMFGCLSTVVTRDHPGIAYLFRVQAATFAQADDLVAPLLEGGPGTPLSPAVTVASYVELQLDGTNVVIRSSLNDRFDHFVIDVDGVVVADLESGLAVQQRANGNGWCTLSTTLPLSIAAPGQVVTLRQQARHDGQPAELVMEL